MTHNETPAQPNSPKNTNEQAKPIFSSDLKAEHPESFKFKERNTFNNGPIDIVTFRNEDKQEIHFAAFGNYRLTPNFNNYDDCYNLVLQHDYMILVNLITAIVEAYSKLQNSNNNEH